MGCCGNVGSTRRAVINWLSQNAATYNFLQQWRKPTDRGLGDTIENMASSIGAKQVTLWLEAIGLSCNCEQERIFWNKKIPYFP